MKYVYVHPQEDRVATISRRRDESLLANPNLQEYIVQDDFDMSKEMPDGNGDTVRLEGFLTATEFLSRFNGDYVAKRVAEYPYIGDQLDAIWKGGADEDAMRQTISAIKAKHPKSGGGA